MPILGQNTWFLRSLPVGWLTDEDQQILWSTLMQALDDESDGASVDWSNPNTGNGGTLTVLDTHPDYDTTCRSVRMENYTREREGRGNTRLCLADDGNWRFAPNRKSG